MDRISVLGKFVRAGALRRAEKRQMVLDHSLGMSKHPKGMKWC